MQPLMTISLDNVMLFGYHGVFSQERTVGANYLLNIDVDVPISAACQSDDLTDTLSYADIYDVAKREFDKPSDLLEHVVWRIATAIKTEWECITQVRVKLSKCNPPIDNFQGSASVSITL